MPWQAACVPNCIALTSRLTLRWASLQGEVTVPALSMEQFVQVCPTVHATPCCACYALLCMLHPDVHAMPCCACFALLCMLCPALHATLCSCWAHNSSCALTEEPDAILISITSDLSKVLYIVIAGCMTSERKLWQPNQYSKQSWVCGQVVLCKIGATFMWISSASHTADGPKHDAVCQ